MTPTVSEGVPSSPALDTLAWSSAGVVLAGTRGPRSDAGSGCSLILCISSVVYGHPTCLEHQSFSSRPIGVRWKTAGSFSGQPGPDWGNVQNRPPNHGLDQEIEPCQLCVARSCGDVPSPGLFIFIAKDLSFGLQFTDEETVKMPCTRSWRFCYQLHSFQLVSASDSSLGFQSSS